MADGLRIDIWGWFEGLPVVKDSWTTPDKAKKNPLLFRGAGFES